MFPEIHDEQVSHAVERVVRETLAFADVLAPPVDAFLVAQRLGLTILRDSSSQSRARLMAGQTQAKQTGVILLADDPRPERRQWAVAHEIGEHLAVDVFDLLGVNPGSSPATSREAIANRVANCLLLPYEWFLHDTKAHDFELLELKKIYCTASHELLARRMLDLPLPVIISIFDKGELTWRRGNRVGLPRELMPVERATQQQSHESGVPVFRQPHELPDELDSIQAWPVVEDDWRREILRVQVNWLEE
ncbi:MAG: ImmA/IrrE family metallo-endopeptidase [Lacipirellulaceae bacterium]